MKPRRNARPSPVVPGAVALLFACLLVSAPAYAAPDLARRSRVEVDLSLLGGAIGAVGTKAPAEGGAGAFDFWLTWRVHPRVRMGWRLGLIVGSMPWGRDDLADDTWTPGSPRFSDYDDRATFLPHNGFVIAVDLLDGLAVDFGAGIGQALVVQHPNDNFMMMSVVGGLGVTYTLAKLDRAVVDLAVRLDYVGAWLKRFHGTFAPQIGFQFRL